jgi:hypothetical protein
MTDTALAIYENMTSLARLDVTPANIDRLWNTAVLKGAVEELQRRICFRGFMDEDGHLRDRGHNHFDCLDFWLDLGGDNNLQAYSDFYCLGQKRICRNCSAVIDALVVIDVNTGKLKKGRCPQCDNDIGGLGLEKANWWQALADVVGEQTGYFATQTAKIRIGLLFKLADFYLASGIIDYNPNKLDSMRYAAVRLANELKDHGFEGTDVYDAVRWAVWSRKGSQVLGIKVNGERSFDQRRALVPVLQLAAEQDVCAPVEEVREALNRPNYSFRENCKEAARILRGVEPEPEPTRVEAFQLDTNGSTSYLIVPASPDELVAFRSLVQLHRWTVDPVTVEQLETIIYGDDNDEDDDNASD